MNFTISDSDAVTSSYSITKLNHRIVPANSLRSMKDCYYSNQPLLPIQSWQKLAGCRLFHQERQTLNIHH